jgi:hypothetical protein
MRLITRHLAGISNRTVTTIALVPALFVFVATHLFAEAPQLSPAPAAQAPAASPQAPATPNPAPAANQGPKPPAPVISQAFVIDGTGSPNQSEIVLPLDSGGTASFAILRQTADAQSAFGLSVSSLVDAQGQVSRAVLVTDGKTESDVLQGLTAPSGVSRVQLRVTPPRPVGRLTGTVTIASGPALSIWRVHVQPPNMRSATLVVDTASQTLRLWRCRIWCGDARSEREFSVRVFDKTRSSPLEGVWVRVDQLAKAGDGFNLARDISFTFNGTTTDLLSPSAAGARTVPAGSQGLVRGTVADIKAAEYNVTLRFGAANSVDDDAQKMTLALLVKEDWLTPLIVLVLAVLASFLATKFVAARRERLGLKSRIATLDASWLRNELPTSAVIWAQANLRLAKSALGSSWAKIPDMVTERVKAVEDILPTLRSIRDLRRAIELSSPHRFITRRAGAGLDRLSAQCSDPPVSAAVLAQIADSLRLLEGWSNADPDEVLKPYWSNVRSAIDRLLARVEPHLAEIPNANDRQAVEALARQLRKALDEHKADAAPPRDAVEIEQQYAALEVLWRNRTRPKIFDKLLQELTKGGNVEALFKITDDDAWARIKAAAENPNALRVMLPCAAPQAFEQFTLRVTTGDRDLDDTFLFRKGLRFAWNIELKRRFFFNQWKLKDALIDAGRLTPESLEPTITQYVKPKGEAKISVTLWNGADSCSPITVRTLEVKKSAAFRAARSFEITEVIPLLLATVVAIGTGMSTLYAGNATFGTLGDYLGLFLWGAAIDQGKNALQGGGMPASQASSQASAPASAPAAAPAPAAAGKTP